MEPTYISAAAATTSTGKVKVVGFDIFSPIINFFFGDQGLGSSIGVETATGFLNTIWLTYVIFAYIFCIILLAIYVYASTHKNALEKLAKEMQENKEKLFEEYYKSGPRNNRVEDMLSHVESMNPNDWKLAIIEADIILDELLKKAGYAGTSLGERLRSISTNQLQSLDDAWQAHKVRNQIAHGGADFVLTHRLAEETIKQYQRVFRELGL